MANEIWVPIHGYDNKYFISNKGRVKSLQMRTNNGELILSQCCDTGGYLQVCLYKNRKRHSVKVHTLVAKHFIDNPSNYKEINHMDENKENNNVSNLEWCSRLYNVNYGSRTEKTMIPVMQFTKDMKLINTYKSASYAGKAIGGNNVANILRCCYGKRKTASGYIWKIAN